MRESCSQFGGAAQRKNPPQFGCLVLPGAFGEPGSGGGFRQPLDGVVSLSQLARVDAMESSNKLIQGLDKLRGGVFTISAASSILHLGFEVPRCVVREGCPEMA